MNEWSVVTVIVALIGLFITVGTPISKLIQSITKLDATVQALRSDMDELTARNTKTHDRIFMRIDEHEDRLNEHEITLNAHSAKLEALDRTINE